MTNSRKVLRRPLEHPAEAMCATALCVSGQLLLGWVLARAAQRAEQEDPQPTATTAVHA